METKSEGEDETSEPTIDNIMKDIFIRCDTDNRDLVQVSKLIEYIKPYMLNYMSELMDLREALDPHNANPEVSSAKFHRVMVEWMSMLNNKEAESITEENSFHNVTPSRDFGKLEFPLMQSSTPRSSFGNRLFKPPVGSILDISCSSPHNSVIDHTPGLNVDKTYLEDQINELNHQNRKTSEELLRVRQQLANAEELCENLQLEVDKVTRQFNHEREINEQMQKDRLEFEDIKECSNNARKQVEKYTKLLSTADKENAALQEKVAEFEMEKQVFEERITKLHAKLDESKLVAVELESKIKDKEDEYAQLEQLNGDLNKELDRHRKMLEDANDANKCLMAEKESVEKLLQRRLKRTSMSRSQMHSQSICDGIVSPVQKLDHSLTSASTSFNVNDSSDSEEFWRINGLNTSNPQSPHDSLQAEFSQIVAEKMCDNPDLSLQLMETENRVLQLENELKEYRNFELATSEQNLEMDNLKLQIKESENKIQNLIAENENLMKELVEKENSLRDFEELRKTCRKLNDESELLHKANQTNLEKVANLLDELELVRKAHQDEVSVLIKTRAEFKVQLSLEKEEKLKLQEEIQELNKLKAEINEKVLATSAINQECQKLQVELENSTLRYRDEILTLEREIKRLKSDQEKLQSETDKTKAENEQLKSKCTIVKDSLTKIDAIHTAKLKELEKDYSDLQEYLTKSKIENERLKTEIEEVKTEVITAKQRESLSEIALAREKEEEKQLRRVIAEIEGEKERLKVRILDSEVQIEEGKKIKEELEDLKKERQEDCKMIQDINSEIQRSKEDVNCLEEKFLKSCDQITFLQTENSNLSESMIRLSTEKDLALDRLSSSTTEIQQLLAVLSKDSICSVCKSSTAIPDNQEKLSGEKLGLKRKISELDTAKGKRNNFDRLKLKCERSEEKIEKLEDMLKLERATTGQLKEENETYAKTIAGIREELEQANSGLFENRQKIRRATFNLVKKWRVLFDNIAVMEDIVDEIDNGEAPSPTRYTDRALEKELYLLKTDIQLNTNILDRLGDTDLLDIIHLLENNQGVSLSRSSNKFSLKPPTLIVRAMSPDSPSIDTEFANVTITGESRPSAESPTSNTRPDSVGTGNGDASSFSGTSGSLSIDEVVSSEENDLKESRESSYEDRNETMHVLDGFGQIFEDVECRSYSDSELETKFTAFVLEVTIDSPSVKKRCEEHSIRMNRAEVELTSAFQTTLTSLRKQLRGDALRQTESQMENLLRGSSHVSRLAEQFGGLKQEHRFLRATNLMINYVSSIRRNLEETNKKLRRCTNLNRELVSTTECPSITNQSPRRIFNFFRGCCWRGCVAEVFRICFSLAVLCLVCLLLLDRFRLNLYYPISWMTVDEILEPLLEREQLDEPPPV